MASSGSHVKTLFVTLHRSLAGKSVQQTRVVKALGLTRLNQVVEQPNSPQIRGMLGKVAHLVRVETDAMYRSRLEAESHRMRPLEPVVVRHGSSSS